jgi:hypothetical protein
MTFVGKILVILQIVFSICFMAFAGAVYTAQTNWKAEHKAVNDRLSETQTELNNQEEAFKKDNDELSGLLATAQNEIGKLQASNADSEARRKRAVDEYNNEREANTKEQALAQRYKSEADFRNKEAGDQRVRNESLLDSRATLIDHVRQMEDEMFNRETELKKLVVKHNLVLLENQTMKKIISANGFSTDLADYKDSQDPPPNVEGKVLSARRGKRSGKEFIEISIGSDDGLLKGHNLFIYRIAEGGKYLGKINIVYVAPDRAVGTVILRARNGSIQRGDNVITKL